MSARGGTDSRSEHDHCLDRFPHASENSNCGFLSSSLDGNNCSNSCGGRYPNAECSRFWLYTASINSSIEARASSID